MKTTCSARRHGAKLMLESPFFVYELDVSQGLRAVAWENRAAGKTIRLGKGPEFEVDIDRAQQRIWISGWRAKIGAASPAAEREAGCRQGFHEPGFDDTAWTPTMSPAQCANTANPSTGCWARTHMFIPRECAGQVLTLVLGGYGLFDPGVMRVWINGCLLGTRRVASRWHEPGRFSIRPDSPAFRRLRFGQDNIVAVHCSKYLCRSERLKELDPREGQFLPNARTWPGQFEQYLLAGKSHVTPALIVTDVRVRREGRRAECGVTLRSAGGNLEALVTYKWDDRHPVLHKSVTVTNRHDRAERLLNVRLGRYQTAARVSEGDVGLPVHLDGHCFMTLVHPAGWGCGWQGSIWLRQFPAILLEPGQSFDCMDVIMGVAREGRSVSAFADHVQSRIRRVVRGHDRPLAIFESFGGWDRKPFVDGVHDLVEEYIFNETESIVADHIHKLRHARRDTGLRFDYCSMEFWVDYFGNLEEPSKKRFPRGLQPLRRQIEALGSNLGLWIDSSCSCWNIGGNPVAAQAATMDLAYGSPAHWASGSYAYWDKVFCRAADPFKTMFTTAFLHHIRANGVRLLKFDNLCSICYNTHHGHWPGVYSTEAIHNAVIESLKEWDAACPEVFLMLYWGYRSPWWLLYGDTLFESGMDIEASRPASQPALRARDSVIQCIDQSQRLGANVPLLGKDSLGVWLSDWEWNSSIGKADWEKAFVMDLCRGSLLAQPWSDRDFLSGPERRRMADFIGLLRANPDCFRRPQMLGGNPWRNEPYGYLCADGKRGFVALFNCTWHDRAFPVELSAAWGLQGAEEWDLYRWYPAPARLRGDSAAFRGGFTIALRPFDIVLLEIVPTGGQPSLERRFSFAPLVQHFEAPTRRLTMAIREAAVVKRRRAPAMQGSAGGDSPARVFRVSGRIPAQAGAGLLAISVQLSRNGCHKPISALGSRLAVSGKVGRQKIHAEAALPDVTCPAPWQTWRVPVTSRQQGQPFLLKVKAEKLGPDIAMAWQGHFLPV